MTDDLKLLYLDRDLLISVKPPRLLSEGGEGDTFPARLADALRARGESDAIYPVHRLDRETEGLMVYARTDRGAAALSRTVAEGGMKKEYLAVVCGSPEPKGTLRDLLFYDRKRGKSYVVDRPRKGVKEALLDYEVLAEREGMSLLRIRLHTGRTHQIRVQLGSRGFPLVGDRRYGAPPSAYSFSLCSALLSFPHPNGREVLTYTYLPEPSEADGRPRAFSVFSEELRG